MVNSRLSHGVTKAPVHAADIARYRRAAHIFTTSYSLLMAVFFLLVSLKNERVCVVINCRLTGWFVLNEVDESFSRSKSGNVLQQQQQEQQHGLLP